MKNFLTEAQNVFSSFYFAFILFGSYKVSDELGRNLFKRCSQ